MSSILVDNLTGKTTAGNVTVTSEQGGATMQLQQGLAKNFIVYNASANTISDSLNASSLTDIGVGNHKVTYTNSMRGNKYCEGGTFCWNGDNSTYAYSLQPIKENDLLAASVEYVSVYASSTASAKDDYTTTMGTVYGDLA